MQAESGEALANIIARKELERQAGGGMFFWGIGNSIRVPSAAYRFHRLPIVFSIMKTLPRVEDTDPGAILAWRRYVDQSGALRELPRNALVTSRATTRTGVKARHNAILCWSDRPLCLSSTRPFDPVAYRNAVTGGAIGFSQVTALIRKVSEEAATGAYAVDMQAEAVSPFVVRLADPIALPASNTFAKDKDDWIEFVRSIRGSGP
jgi:hypothetical protein